MKKLTGALLALTLSTLTTMAQIVRTDSDAPQLRSFTLNDLIPGGSTYYANNVPQNRYYAWWGERAVCLDIDHCSLVDPETGAETTLCTLIDINAAIGADDPLRHFYTAEFPSATDPLILVDTGRRRVLVNWQSRTIVWSQDYAPDADGQDFCYATRSLAFVREHNLYVTLADGTTRAVSTDGCHDVVYGESVHRDEFGIEKGTFWSPDGQRLAFYRMDQTLVTDYPQVSIALPLEGGGSRCAQLEPDKYPMAGETSHKVTVGIYDIRSGQTTWLDLGDPTDRYFTNLAWAPDGSRLYIAEVNRDQNHCQLDAYDTATGRRIKTLFEESDPRYVEPMAPMQFLPWDDGRFVWLSRRDGYNHLYLYTADGRMERQLTKGNFEVFAITGFDRASRSVVFTANADDPIGCANYSVSMKGVRKLLGEKRGWHTPTLSQEGSQFIDHWTWGGDKDYGRHIELVAPQRTTVLADIEEPWNRFRQPNIKVGTIKAADGRTDLYYRLVLPPDFDPSRKYPAIVYVYGGPHAHNIDASRHYGVRGWDVWMAQNGYVMFCLDNRGSEHRGRDFEQATFRRLGVEEMKDQLCGVEYLRSLPYVDGDRLGVHGWSFGGYMTTSLLTTYPGTFKVGVAGGPVIDWRYYEVMYGERYMDTPETNPEGYAETSCLAKADKLSDRLLIIYGGNDPTCVPQHTLSFIRACIDAGTHPDLFTYPGDGHNMMGTDRVHLHEHISRYFFDHLK